MALTADQAVEARREAVLAVFGGGPVNVTKTQIDAAIAACVTWIETNAASAVAAMNGTALENASTAVKAKVLSIAIAQRYGS